MTVEFFHDPELNRNVTRISNVIDYTKKKISLDLVPCCRQQYISERKVLEFKLLREGK